MSQTTLAVAAVVAVLMLIPALKTVVPWYIGKAKETFSDLRGLFTSTSTLVSNKGGWVTFFAGAVVYALLSTGVSYVRTLELPDIPWNVPTVTHGPRRILIAYETSNQTADFKGSLTGLRSGVADEYLTSKKHNLDILDVDAKDKDGNPTKAVLAWKETFPGRQMPAIIISDSNGKVVYSGGLPVNATTTQIMDIVRAHE